MTIRDNDVHYAEQFPLSAIDDHLIHQTPEPIRVVASTDPRFFDRYWSVLHDDTGELMMALGGSFYPNLDRAEAYAIVTYKGVQRSVRAYRALGADRMDLRVGPLKHEILRGMREWRLLLEDNEWGISFDLNWTDTKRQIYHASYGSLNTGAPAGKQRDVNAGFEGFGVASGWVMVDGKRIEVTLPKQLFLAGGSKSSAPAPKRKAHSNVQIDSGKALTSQMQATVVKIAVQEGDSVTKGQQLLVLEAMKMESPQNAVKDAVIKKIHVAVGATVPAGTMLIEFED